MFYYLEALIANTELNYSQEMLKQILELCFDLVLIFAKTTIDQSRS